MAIIKPIRAERVNFINASRLFRRVSVPGNAIAKRGPIDRCVTSLLLSRKATIAGQSFHAVSTEARPVVPFS